MGTFTQVLFLAIILGEALVLRGNLIASKENQISHFKNQESILPMSNYLDVLRDIKAKNYQPIYWLQGEETYFIDQIADYMEEHILTESEKGFNQMVMYGKDVDAATIITTASRYPMMAARQVVIVKEAHQVKDLAKLQSYAEKPIPSTILLIVHKYKSLRSNSKLAKAIAKNGVFFSAAKYKDYQVPAWIQRYVKERKYNIQQDAITLLFESLGNKLSRISNELDKLMLNVPQSQAITKQHIADNIGISKEYNIFELQRALANNQTEKIFRIGDYFANNPKAAPLVVVIGSLYRFFNRLYLYHHVRGGNQQNILTALNLRSNYALKDYQAAIKYYNLAKTKHAINLLYQYDLKSKGVGNPSTPTSELLKEMLVRVVQGM